MKATFEPSLSWPFFRRGIS